MATGIRARHARNCKSRESGRCSCKPTYQAQAYDTRTGRQVWRTFPTLSAAKLWRQDAQVALRRGTMRPPTAKTIAESESGSAATYSCARSGGSMRSRRPRIAGRSRLSVGSIEISSLRIARRKMTRSGSRIRDGRGGQALLSQVVDEVLDVPALNLRQPPAADRRDDVRAEELLVAASGRRLVRLVRLVPSWAPAIRTSAAQSERSGRLLSSVASAEANCVACNGPTSTSRAA